MKKTLYLCLCVLFSLALLSTKTKAQTIASHVTGSDSACGVVQFNAGISGCTTGLTMNIYFGDGTSATTPVFCSGSTGYAMCSHMYSGSGSYTIKMVLYSGTTAIDSIVYGHYYEYCRILPIACYRDNNSNCTYDAGIDDRLVTASKIAVDSAGVRIDTIYSLYSYGYNALGAPGTVYTFTLLSAPVGQTLACSSTGVMSVSVPMATFAAPTTYYAFVCSSTSSYDLAINAHVRAAITKAQASVLVHNSNCTATPATIKVDFSPKYTFSSLAPAFSYTVAGNTIIIDAGSVSATTPVQVWLYFNPATSLMVGDTIQTRYTVSPTTDADPTNNVVIRVDSIRGSYDPNAKSVTPTGDISPGTKLEYMIEFENDGNDTAYNIHVMDTLSPFLDVNTFKVVTSTHPCQAILDASSGQNIIKFDFPNILLPDSSHHDYCRGSVIFTINAKTSLTPGTVISNRGGIYFDTNPVVMTNSAYNRIPLPTSVKKVSLTKVEIYPNPVSDVLTVNTDGSFNNLTITNTIGQVVLSQSVGANQAKVNVKTLPAGIYHLTLKGDNGVKVQQFEKL
jgi:uncharacterized repeat protein (TIGR01451 family)